MAGFDWKQTLATVAPMIASAVGSPVAGMAVSAGLSALGITPQPGSEEQQLAEAMKTATPEQFAALKQAELQFQKDMKSLDIDLAKINQADRASARQMFAAGGKTAQIILSVVYTIAYGVVLYCFMTGQIKVPSDQQVLFGSLIGILTAAQVQILNFWFGSSAGSKDKTQLLGGKANA